jgi:acyl-CoA thioesterase-1
MLAVISCGPGPSRTPVPGDAPAPQPDAPAQPERRTPPRIVVLGDSLTSGLGLNITDAYPSLLQQKLKAKGLDFEVVNAGVSGDTSADGLRRANWALEGDVRLLILALGANDGLRGLPVAQMKKNLTAIVHRARQRGIPVLLAGMEAPPNFGPEYIVEFRQAFRDLAREQQLELVPFLLHGVAGDAGLNQPDGLHPNRTGAARIADHLWPDVERIIDTQVVSQSR